MKILITILILIVSNATSSDWVNTNKISSGFLKLECIDDDNCYGLSLAGENSYLFRSTDGAKTWDTLYTINFWELLKEGDEPYLHNVKDLVVVDTNVIFLTFWDVSVPYFLKSIDGGKSFEKIKIEGAREDFHVRKLIMYDKDIGYAQVAAESYVTLDSWKTHKRVDLNTKLISDGYFKGDFLDDSHILFCISDTNNPWDRYLDFIVKYNIYSDTFDVLHSIKEEHTFSPSHLDIVNDSLVFLIGNLGIEENDTSRDYILRGTGKNLDKWVTVLNEMHESPFAIQEINFYDENNGFVVGSNGKMLYTNDGGDTWLYHRPDDIWFDPEDIYGPIGLRGAWAGKKPIIGTRNGWMYEYVGDYFKFDQLKDFSYQRVNEDSYCYDTQPFELDLIKPKGGDYSGEGVENNIFDPSVVGGGEHNINYKYSADGFVDKDTSIVLVVNDYIEPPAIKRDVDTLYTQYEIVEWYNSGDLETLLEVGKSFEPEFEGTYVAKFKDENNCESNFSEDFLFTYSSVESREDELIITDQFISFSSTKLRNISNVIISDYLGRNVEVELNGGEIDISNLEKGAYLLSYLFEGKRNSIKFIKK